MATCKGWMELHPQDQPQGTHRVQVKRHLRFYPPAVEKVPLVSDRDRPIELYESSTWKHKHISCSQPLRALFTD